MKFLQSKSFVLRSFRSFLVYSVLFFMGQNMGFGQGVPLNLKEALQLAGQNRADLQNLQNKEKIAGNDMVKAKSAFLPTVDFAVDGRWNTQLQTSVLPAGAFGNPESQKIQIGTPINLQAYVQADQKILDPSLKTNLRIAEIKVQTEQFNTKKALADIELAIATAYYSMALVQEKVKLTNDNVKLLEELSTQVQIRKEQGNALSTDVEKAGLDLKNALFQQNREKINLRQARLVLAKELGLARDFPEWEVSGLDELEKEISKNRDTSGLDKRFEIQIERNNLKVNQLTLKKYQKDGLPRLNAYGFLAVQSFRSDFNVTKEVYPFNYLGLKMTMPLFDAHKRRDNKSEAGLLIRQNEIKLKDLENTVVYERKAALEQMESALGALQVAKENRILAEKLYSNTKVKFEEANALKTDVLSSSKAVQDARTNYLSALYDLFVAHLNKLKADGKGLVF